MITINFLNSEVEKNHMLSREEVDVIWQQHVGSSFISEYDELKRLRVLDIYEILPGHQVYSLYLRTKYWKKLRFKVMQRDGFACVMCKAVRNLHVHHDEYGAIGKEDMNDLRTLCYDCHANITESYDLKSSTKIDKSPISVESRQLFSLLRQEKK